MKEKKMQIETSESYGKKTVEDNVYLVEFDSIKDFLKYLDETPFNKVYQQECYRSSFTGTKGFTGTENFEQAMSLLKNGWDDTAKKMNMDISKMQFNKKLINKTLFDSVGFQCSVPRYLMGVPDSMINSKKVVIKNKIINITKNVYFTCRISTETMIEEGIKTLAIIKQLEKIGYRVNLDVVMGSAEDDGRNKRRNILIKIRIKNASERLNISKIAFPIAHPSMLRRLYLNFLEKYPYTTDRFRIGYGYCISRSVIKKIINNGPNDLYIGEKVELHSEDIKTVRSLKDLEKAIDSYYLKKQEEE